ncbi:MAG: restriction endonuclease [Cyanobacteria bacterium]|nr:restriction endonuclease [Cyanobacteriota bacterium]
MNTNRQERRLSDKVKKLSEIGELFELQLIIDDYLNQFGIKWIINEIIEALDCKQHNIPLINELLDFIFTRDSVKKNDTSINVIEDYLPKKQYKLIRLSAIKNITKLRPQKSSILLVQILNDKEESREIKLLILESLIHASFTNNDMEKFLNIFQEDDEEISLKAMDILEYHHHQVPVVTVQKELEKLLFSSNVKLKCKAIELLGLFGEIDIIERLYCISTLDFSEKSVQDSLNTMIKTLMSKPINILYIRPENFEYLTKKLFQSLNYDNVEQTRNSKDNGIDIIAYKKGFGLMENRKQCVVAQCKRYAKNKITRREIQELLNAMQNHGATEGYFITTSSFAPDAEELAVQNGHIILLDKVKLQLQLDRIFGVNKYCIVNHN